jgi:asparagine synthase (glutamine-hydrolyzing)
MCGIAGFMRTMPIDEAGGRSFLEILANNLQHRGPDGEGFFQHGTAGLAHRRLAVIDLEGGRQPIVDESGCALIANAEIYNYKQLKSELLRADANLTFQTNSDCEPVLVLYRKYGESFVEHLRGMYALAIYDPKTVSGKERLVLARDPFGIKPLYYLETNTGVFFASEIRALTQLLSSMPDAEATLPSTKAPLPITKATLNTSARNALLELQFSPGPETIWNPIRRVMPGEMLIVEEGKVVAKRKQEALPQPMNGASHAVPTNIATALPLLNEVLKESVALHLQSDVPVGLFLSSGIDSNSILTIATQDLEHPLHTFTIGFPDSHALDERADARLFTDNPLITHHEIAFSKDDFWSLLPQVVECFDDPIADYAAVPVFKLASIAKEHVKVVLTGEGGDEMFAGYESYLACLLHKKNMQQLKDAPAFNRLLGAGLLKERKMRAFGFLQRVGLLGDSTQGWRKQLDEVENEEEKQSTRSHLQQLQAIDTREWLPHDLLLKIDRCLMWHGLEGRTPLVDVNVARFAFLLPDVCKINGSAGKAILRKWLQSRHPGTEISAKKRSFTVPVGPWILERADRLAVPLSQQAGLLEMCRGEDIKSFLLDLRTHDQQYAAWLILYYALWHQIHVLKRPVQATVEDTLDQ